MTVLEYNSIEQLDPLTDDWRRLLATTPYANFFQSLDWLKAYWRHFGHSQRLRVLACEHGGEITGIFPIVVRKERTKVGALRFATYPLDYWGSFYGPLGARPSDTLAAAVDYLQWAPRDWDVFEPRWIGTHASEICTINKILNKARVRPVLTYLDASSVIRLPQSVDEYLASRTSKWRNNRRRWDRRFKETGEVEYVRYRPAGESHRDGGPRWDLYQQCLQIANSSWQGASQTGTTLTHPSVATFLREVHEAAAKCGGLDLNLLYLDGKPIAFAYNYCHKGYVSGLRAGYDPSVNPQGAGNLLYALAIEDSIRRGDWRYDLGPSHQECKRQLITDVMPIGRFSCFSENSIRQWLLRWKRARDSNSTNKALAMCDALNQ